MKPNLNTEIQYKHILPIYIFQVDSRMIHLGEEFHPNTADLDCWDLPTKPCRSEPRRRRSPSCGQTNGEGLASESRGCKIEIQIWCVQIQVPQTLLSLFCQAINNALQYF